MAKNEQDGRSLEERLASLDAMNGDFTGQATEGDDPTSVPEPMAETDPGLQLPANPWLTASAPPEQPAHDEPYEPEPEPPAPWSAGSSHTIVDQPVPLPRPSESSFGQPGEGRPGEGRPVESPPGIVPPGPAGYDVPAAQGFDPVPRPSPSPPMPAPQPEYGSPGQYDPRAQYDSGTAPPLGQGLSGEPGRQLSSAPPLSPLPPPAESRPAPETSDSLSADTLLRGRRQPPAGGWRRLVYKASGGTVHPGESPAELRRRELTARACTPVAGGHHRVAVMSLKGGVGKTTTTAGLGAALASLRGDRVIAVDANPDRGTLSDKVRLETAATVRDLLNERAQIKRYADVRAFTSQSTSRLEVLASDRDPAVSEAFSADDYCAVAELLEHFYSICLTDCGTGLLHSAMAGVLSLADQLVLVSSPSVDGARSASATLDWLEAHEQRDLVRNGVVVLSMVRSRSKSTVDLDRLQEHFESRCRTVVRIPYDPHLEEGAELDLERLSAQTQDAYLQLAATVGDGFAWPR